MHTINEICDTYKPVHYLDRGIPLTRLYMRSIMRGSLWGGGFVWYSLFTYFCSNIGDSP